VELKLKSTETDLVEFSPDKRIHRQVSWYAIHSQRPLDLPAFSLQAPEGAKRPEIGYNAQ